MMDDSIIIPSCTSWIFYYEQGIDVHTIIRIYNIKSVILGPTLTNLDLGTCILAKNPTLLSICIKAFDISITHTEF